MADSLTSLTPFVQNNPQPAHKTVNTGTQSIRYSARAVYLLTVVHPWRLIARWIHYPGHVERYNCFERTKRGYVVNVQETVSSSNDRLACVSIPYAFLVRTRFARPSCVAPGERIAPLHLQKKSKVLQDIPNGYFESFQRLWPRRSRRPHFRTAPPAIHVITIDLSSLTAGVRPSSEFELPNLLTTRQWSLNWLATDVCTVRRQRRHDALRGDSSSGRPTIHRVPLTGEASITYRGRCTGSSPRSRSPSCPLLRPD